MASKRTTKRVTIKRTMAQAFDVWMRSYIADPQAFAAEFQSVADHQRGRVSGRGATEYGLACAALLRSYMAGK